MVILRSPISQLLSILALSISVSATPRRIQEECDICPGGTIANPDNEVSFYDLSTTCGEAEATLIENAPSIGVGLPISTVCSIVRPSLEQFDCCGTLEPTPEPIQEECDICPGGTIANPDIEVSFYDLSTTCGEAEAILIENAPSIGVGLPISIVCSIVRPSLEQFDCCGTLEPTPEPTPAPEEVNSVVDVTLGNVTEEMSDSSIEKFEEATEGFITESLNEAGVDVQEVDVKVTDQILVNNGRFLQKMGSSFRSLQQETTSLQVIFSQRITYTASDTNDPAEIASQAFENDVEYLEVLQNSDDEGFGGVTETTVDVETAIDESEDESDDESGDGTLAESGGACFSAMATTYAKNRGKILVKDIEVGDRVLASKNRFQLVYTVDHKDPNKPEIFVQIYSTANEDKPLELTKSHMVFLDGKEKPVPASAVKVGDLLQTVNDDSPSIVTRISFVSRVGIWNPITADGTIVVDGVVTSAYNVPFRVNPDAGVEIAGVKNIMSHHDLLHFLMSPYRVMCIGLSLTLCETEHELNGYSQLGTRILQFFNKQNAVAQDVMIFVAIQLAFTFKILSYYAQPRVAGAVFGIVIYCFMVAWGKKKAKKRKLQ